MGKFEYLETVLTALIAAAFVLSVVGSHIQAIFNG